MSSRMFTSRGRPPRSVGRGTDAVDAALIAFLLAWGSTPTLGSLGGFDSAAADGFEAALYGGADTYAFFGPLLPDKAPDRTFPGQDLN